MNNRPTEFAVSGELKVKVASQFIHDSSAARVLFANFRFLNDSPQEFSQTLGAVSIAEAVEQINNPAGPIQDILEQRQKAAQIALVEYVQQNSEVQLPMAAKAVDFNKAAKRPAGFGLFDKRSPTHAAKNASPESSVEHSSPKPGAKS